ncbi:hypothetical protein [Stagnihabitans tardus]|uniref:Uncharacterized protein n=1 Tax=Stagnihabitans tardus TaxID=2699202 RepID=A0AAE4YF39_9RHOB|nr:hypothetical protein [Stagnihabitans tardus]NBZ88720.1 hypothetical protein [Stagnihabitans tardus]
MTVFRRMVTWLCRPPGRVAVVPVTVGLCLLLVGIETIRFWPEALRVNGRPGP